MSGIARPCRIEWPPSRAGARLRRIDFCEVLGYENSSSIRIYRMPPVPPHPKGKMTISKTPSSVAERRLAIARRLYSALVAQQPYRVFTLNDGQGRVLASSAPTPDQDVEDNSA